MQASRFERREVVGHGSSRLRLVITDHVTVSSTTTILVPSTPTNSLRDDPSTTLHAHAVEQCSHRMAFFRRRHPIRKLPFVFYKHARPHAAASADIPGKARWGRSYLSRAQHAVSPYIRMRLRAFACLHFYFTTQCSNFKHSNGGTGCWRCGWHHCQYIHVCTLTFQLPTRPDAP
jgi:hypothetical protein